MLDVGIFGTNKELIELKRRRLGCADPDCIAGRLAQLVARLARYKRKSQTFNRQGLYNIMTIFSKE